MNIIEPVMRCMLAHINHLVNSSVYRSTRTRVNRLISLMELREAAWLRDQTRLGPKTMARLAGDILFSASLDAT